MVEHQSAESEVLRFDSSRGLRMFSLSHTRDKVKIIRLVTLLLCHLYADQSSSQLVLRALLSKPSFMVSLLQFLSPVRIHSLFSDAYVESVDSNLQLKSAQRCFEESGGW